MRRTPEQLKYLVNHGALAATISFTLFIIIWKMGYFPLGESSFAFSWIPFLFMMIGTKGLRNNFLSNTISYWDAFRSQMTICMAYGLLFALFIYIFGSIIEPNFLLQYKNENLKALDVAGDAMKNMLGDESYDRIEDEMIANFEKITLGSLCSSEFFNKIIFGVIFSLISSLIIKKRPNID